jgi:hypothetical protein
MNKPQYIIVHHTAVSRTKNANQFDATKRYHIDKGWGDIGYNWLIEPSGETKQGRGENMDGAHCKEEGMNFNSIGICLTGNFDEELPTQEQRNALYWLINDRRTKYNIPDTNINPHRRYATYKSCWGKLLPDDVMGYLKSHIKQKEQTVSEWAVNAIEKAKKKGITVWTNPQEIIGTQTLEAMLFKLGLCDSDTKIGMTKERIAVVLDKLHLLD